MKEEELEVGFDARNLTIACYFLKYRLAFGFISFKLVSYVSFCAFTSCHECRTILVGVFSTNRCLLFGHSGFIILRKNKIAHLGRSSEGSFSLSKTQLG